MHKGVVFIYDNHIVMHAYHLFIDKYYEFIYEYPSVMYEHHVIIYKLYVFNYEWLIVNNALLIITPKEQNRIKKPSNFSDGLFFYFLTLELQLLIKNESKS